MRHPLLPTAAPGQRSRITPGSSHPRRPSPGLGKKPTSPGQSVSRPSLKGRGVDPALSSPSGRLVGQDSPCPLHRNHSPRTLACKGAALLACLPLRGCRGLPPPFWGAGDLPPPPWVPGTASPSVGARSLPPRPWILRSAAPFVGAGGLPPPPWGTEGLLPPSLGCRGRAGGQLREQSQHLSP